MPTKVDVSRAPYVVSYRDNDGELKTIRRVPPAKLHKFETDDVVTISRKRGDDWNTDSEVKVIGVNKRQPNTLMVENAEGRHTFLTYTDVRGKARNQADAELQEDFNEKQRDPIGSDYLLWP
ncbi:hypothetical protein EBR21_14045 [bacterium]|nr:hypothetical protein [bacterium]